mgnify:CR=1 FL=1
MQNSRLPAALLELIKDYDAVFLAVGLGNVPDMEIPGETIAGVVDGLEFIEETKVRLSQNVNARLALEVLLLDIPMGN